MEKIFVVKIVNITDDGPDYAQAELYADSDESKPIAISFGDTPNKAMSELLYEFDFNAD